MSESTERVHVGEYLRDEMEARGWTLDDVVERSDGTDVLRLELELILAQPDGLYINERTAKALARAFGTSAELWLNLGGEHVAASHHS